ncbi:hypothetical protein [Pseudoxanthomonas dokdonensis]|uniref:Uncharacterized protein n=1 Tax=Pseudoxanthomonas dokdonensis TaxID=344882 RepID=A0A0R0CIC9_9GAMM|nr:hypothetical protein [Pseudoxanthomonas dokdonensis]KRG69333.1 hypothetical protein ABB29_09510 [Pseudoxanthomonas dokdonensis]
MNSLANRIKGKSFLWPCLLFGIVSVFFISFAPAMYDVTWAIVGFLLFAPLFILQTGSGVALDNWWVARIDRKTQPYSYWFRVVFWGLGTAGFAYRIFVPVAV